MQQQKVGQLSCKWFRPSVSPRSFFFKKDCKVKNNDFDSEEDVIRQLEEQERQAVLQQDLAALERLWAEEFIVNNPQNQISPSRDAVLALVRQGLIRYKSFERRLEEARCHVADNCASRKCNSSSWLDDPFRLTNGVRRKLTHLICATRKPFHSFGFILLLSQPSSRPHDKELKLRWTVENRFQ